MQGKQDTFISPPILNYNDDPRNSYIFRPFNVISLTSPKSFSSRQRLLLERQRIRMKLEAQKEMLESSIKLEDYRKKYEKKVQELETVK